MLSVRSFSTLGTSCVKSLSNASSVRCFSDVSQGFNEEPRFKFAQYSVYKGKAAAQFKPIVPTFEVKNKSKTLTREGALLLEIAPTMPNAQGSSLRDYDWNKKVLFSLSVTECAEISRAKETSKIQFVHDPNMNSSEAGKMVKKLSFEPTSDGKGMFLNVSVVDKVNAAGSVSYSIPIGWAELEVVKTLTTFCIPRFLGVDKVFE